VLAPFVEPGDRIICITKGLEADDDGNLVILPDVLRQEFPTKVREQVSIAAVGGPCIAGELAGRRQSCVYFGSREIETAEQLAEVFRTEYYRIWTTNDIEGLEISVALKNAYALGVGIATGILAKSGGIDAAGAHMHNLAAALFARSCMEISIFLEMMGVRTDFAFGLPGIGDLYVTCQGGRSVTIGRLLGEGKTYKEASQILAGETLEAVMIVQQMGKALPKIFDKGLLKESQIPFMTMLIDTIVHEKPVEFKLNSFFNDKIH
jgi:glycerol-3-phosphate dehydrogenase (NAD(P)+)